MCCYRKQNVIFTKLSARPKYSASLWRIQKKVLPAFVRHLRHHFSNRSFDLPEIQISMCGMRSRQPTKKNILFKLKFEFSNFLHIERSECFAFAFAVNSLVYRGDDDDDRFDEKIHKTYVTTARGERLAVGHVSHCAPFVFYVGYSIFFFFFRYLFSLSTAQLFRC